MSKKRIHVNQHHKRSNKTKGTDLDVITIKEGRKNTYCNEVEILGPSRIVYCGSGRGGWLVGDKMITKIFLTWLWTFSWGYNSYVEIFLKSVDYDEF